MDIGALRHLRELELESLHLNLLRFNLSLEHLVLKDVVKNTVTLEERRAMAVLVPSAQGLSERQAFCIGKFSRCVRHLQAKKTDDSPLATQLRQLPDHQPRRGYSKLTE